MIIYIASIGGYKMSKKNKKSKNRKKAQKIKSNNKSEKVFIALKKGMNAINNICNFTRLYEFIEKHKDFFDSIL